MTIDVDVLEQLMPNILTILTQLCATAILFLLMKKFAWEPVKKILAARSQFEQGKLAEAEEYRAEQEKLKREAEKQLEEAGQQARETIQKAREEGERLKDSIVSEGKERSRQMLEDAEKDIELQRTKMLDEVHKDIVNAAIDTASKMLGEKVDDKADRKVVESFIKEVSKK